MIEQEKIENLYKLIINGYVINDHTLLNSDFTEKDIEKLIECNVITPTKNNTYKLVNVDKFRKYGVKLLSTGCIKAANECFRICYTLAPNGKNITLQYLLAAIIKKDYQKALTIFANLETIQPEKYRKDNNLYLYLLSNITELEGEYLERIKQLREKDIVLVETYENKRENDIRRAILNDKFIYAYKLINPLISRETEYSVKYELIRTLLLEIAKKQKASKETLSSLVVSENYEEILEELDKKEKYSHLSKSENYIYLIVKAIININRTHTIPVSIETKGHNMYNALISNDFKKALEINEYFLESKHENKSKDLIHNLLIKLNKLILEIKENSSPSTTIIASSQEDSTQEQDTDEKEEINIITDIFENQKVKDALDFANYLRSLNIPLEISLKKYGFVAEQVLLIKLIYVRDYYIEGNFIAGDKLIQEVENSFQKTEIVNILINEIKSNRQKYLNSLDKYIKSKKKN